MTTGDWLQEIYDLIEETKPENREILLLKWTKLAKELGYIPVDD